MTRSLFERKEPRVPKKTKDDSLNISKRTRAEWAHNAKDRDVERRTKERRTSCLLAAGNVESVLSTAINCMISGKCAARSSTRVFQLSNLWLELPAAWDVPRFDAHDQAAGLLAYASVRQG